MKLIKLQDFEDYYAEAGESFNEQKLLFENYDIVLPHIPDTHYLETKEDKLYC